MSTRRWTKRRRSACGPCWVLRSSFQQVEPSKSQVVLSLAEPQPASVPASRTPLLLKHNLFLSTVIEYFMHATDKKLTKA